MIANLVLLPRALAALTDHSPEVQQVLQFRSFELYGWYPAGQEQPTKPAHYPTEWREPMPFSPSVKSALATRSRKMHGVAGAISSEPSVSAGRDYTKYDVTVGTTTFEGLPKRVAMVVVVKEIVRAGVSPAHRCGLADTAPTPVSVRGGCVG